MRLPAVFWTAIALLMLAAGQATAERGLLAGLMARPPVSASEPAMSALALEACLKLAASLDRSGAKVASDGARIEKLTAERLALQNQINGELDQLTHYDAKAMEAFQRRVAHNDDVERRLNIDGPAYEHDRKARDDALAEFRQTCSGSFTAAELAAVKARLGVK